MAVQVFTIDDLLRIGVITLVGVIYLHTLRKWFELCRQLRGWRRDALYVFIITFGVYLLAIEAHGVHDLLFQSVEAPYKPSYWLPASRSGPVSSALPRRSTSGFFEAPLLRLQ